MLMPKQFLTTIGVCILAFILLPSTVLAQTNTPLLMLVNGVLFRLDSATLTPYSECQPSSGLIQSVPIVAPTNEAFALVVRPNAVTEFLENGIAYAFDTPTDIWVCANNTLTPVAINDTLNLSDTDTNNDGVTRSLPAWNTDGQALAWTEWNGVSNSVELAIADLSSNTVNRIQTTLQVSVGFSSAPEIYWTTFGIHVYNYEEVGGNREEALYSYTPQGQFLTRVRIAVMSDPNDFVIEKHFAYNNQIPYLAVRYGTQGWAYFHVFTGQNVLVSTTDFSITPANISTPINEISYNATDTLNVWQTISYSTPDGQPEEFIGYGANQIAFSPDGAQIAYLTEQLELWDSGETGQIENTMFAPGDDVAIVWSALRWTISEVPMAIQCPNLPVTQFGVGQNGRVVAKTSANNVRDLPTINGARIGQLAPLATFVTQIGPICADGYIWWQVLYNENNIGWTVEATPTEYWLEPIE
jgi:hypothetical protein